jgi:hypothetical protein
LEKMEDDTEEGRGAHPWLARAWLAPAPWATATARQDGAALVAGEKNRGRKGEERQEGGHWEYEGWGKRRGNAVPGGKGASGRVAFEPARVDREAMEETASRGLLIFLGRSGTTSRVTRRGSVRHQVTQVEESGEKGSRSLQKL